MTILIQIGDMSYNNLHGREQKDQNTMVYVHQSLNVIKTEMIVCILVLEQRMTYINSI